MLPVVRGEGETRRQILLYTVLLYAVTQLPFCAGGVRRHLPGLRRCCWARVFISGAVRAATAAPTAAPRCALYLFSLAYLALLFAAMVVDARVF